MNEKRDAIGRKANVISLGGIVIGAGMLIFFYVAHSMVKEKSQQAGIEKSIEIVEQQTRTQEKINMYREEIKNLGQFGSRVVKVETQAVGAAHWLGMLVEEFKYAGGSINSTEILNGKQGSLMTRVRVRLSGKIKVEGLREFLYRIESGERFLDVERLVLSRNNAPAFQEQLSIDVVVGSYVKLPALLE